MFLEYFFACLSGVASGFVVGLLPGIGPAVVMILVFTIMLKVKMILALIFYCCMMSACQFGGSITALAAGLPGETNSFPLLKIRPQLIEQDLQSSALFLCAAGHVIGALSTFAISYLIIDRIADSTAYLRSYVMVGFGILGMILCMAFSDNRWYISLAMFVSAWILARVGINLETRQYFMTFDNLWLSGGLPTISVILGIYAFPSVLRSLEQRIEVTDKEFNFSKNISNKLILLKGNFFAIVRGNLIGFFSGIIPYVGIDLSSYIAFYVERSLKKSILNQIIASETATNAAGISVLLPLLIYGIAIQPSESILLEAVNSGHNVVNWATVSPMFTTIAVWLVIANMACFFLSWNLVGPVISSLRACSRYVPWFMCAMCVYTVYSIGVLYGQSVYYISVMLVFGIIGYLLRARDTLPFIFIFMLQHSLESAILRFYYIYIQ